MKTCLMLHLSATAFCLFLSVLAEPDVSYLPPSPGGGGGGYNYGRGGGGGGGGDDGPSEPANYEFSYEVQDAASGNDFGHKESRMGHVARGMYHVLLPDGRTQRVDYVADQGGYKPNVKYEGTATFGNGGGRGGGGRGGGAGGPGYSYGAPAPGGGNGGYQY